MRNDTRKHFNNFLANQAALNGVASAVEKFAIDPTVQQRLENKIQETSEFLNSINIVPVTEMEGEKLALGVTGPVASRTNTENKDRQTRDLKDLKAQRYRCERINYDTHIRYQTMDMWAKFKDFQIRLSRAILERCALDRIMVGFNGVSAAADTDLVANPLGQDIAKGWLQGLREAAPENVLSEGAAAAGKVKVGQDANGLKLAAAHYGTLDGMVYDTIKKMLDPWHVGAADLVCITGRDMMHDKLFPLVDSQKAPSEKLAADIVVSQRRLGGLQVVEVPHFPESAILITSLKNLSIYYQEGARRRAVIDNPKRDRVETYESSNDAFVIEDLGKACLIENIELQAP